MTNKHVKRLAIREMQINTTVNCSFKPTKIGNIKKKIISSDDKNVEKLEPSYIGGGNVKLCSYFGKQSGHSSKG